MNQLRIGCNSRFDIVQVGCVHERRLDAVPAKHIAKQDDRAYAAGRAVRQALKRMQNGK